LRVVWGTAEMIDTFSPHIVLIRVDLPADGRPMIATKPERLPFVSVSFIRTILPTTTVTRPEGD
jgi:hypothetical protein